MEAHGASGGSVGVEIRGLSVYSHHGVTEAEREIGQRLEIDVRFTVADCAAVRTDRLEDTVDYAEACDVVVHAATDGSYSTLERLCEVIADRLLDRFACDAVHVRAAKPEPPLRLPVERVAVELVRERAGDGERGA